MTPPLFDGILPVVVLYKKGVGESETLLSLSNSVSKGTEKIDILIYDNSPVPQWHDDEGQYDGFRIRYISDPTNPGVSRAYNVGFELARELHKKWLLLLDQDTVFPDDALSVYAAHIERHGSPALLAPMLVSHGAIYSPCRQIGSINFPLHAVRPGRLGAKRLSVLNSGMCIRLDAFEKTGGFDERIRLDFADHDFMRRYRKHFASFLLIDMVCQHGFSDKEISDIDASLARFSHYCEGARNSIKSPADPFSLLPVALVRVTRLSLRFRSTRFLKLLLRTFSRK